MADEKIIVAPTGEPIVEKRKTDKVFEAKIQPYMDEIKRLQLRWYLGISGFLLFITLLVGVILFIQTRQADALKDARYEGYVKSCDAQNIRNQNTVSEIRKSEQPEEDKVFRIKLVNLLQPYIPSCTDFAKSRTKDQ